MFFVQIFGRFKNLVRNFTIFNEFSVFISNISSCSVIAPFCCFMKTQNLNKNEHHCDDRQDQNVNFLKNIIQLVNGLPTTLRKRTIRAIYLTATACISLLTHHIEIIVIKTIALKLCGN